MVAGRTTGRRRAFTVVGAIALVAVLSLVASTCSSDKGESGRAEDDGDRPVVRIAYVVESSWFATTPEMIGANLDKIGMQMKSCASSTDQTCQVMVFAVQGAEVAPKRVPSSLTPDSELGYWYSLDTDIDPEHEAAHEAAIDNKVQDFLSEVRAEIVPESYEDQVKGCVNLVDNIAGAMRALARTPGDRNVVEIHASGLSNCKNQPFYPDKAFPSAESATKQILDDVPPGAGELDGGGAICVQWTPLFGTGVTAKGAYISQEQRQILKQAWIQVMDAWGVTQGNEPGEQQGDCLTMEVDG